MSSTTHREDFTEGEQRYDLILDNVGTRSLSETRRALKPTGILVANGAPVGGWFGGLTRPITAFGVSLFVKQQAKPFVSTTKPEDLATLKELAEAGKLMPIVERTYPLTEAPEAVAHVGAGHAQGKTVITVA